MVAPQVVLPLDLNTRVKGRWKDGEYYRCKILERRTVSEFNAQTADTNPAAAWEYYVHFSGSEWRRGGTLDLFIADCTQLQQRLLLVRDSVVQPSKRCAKSGTI